MTGAAPAQPKRHHANNIPRMSRIEHGYRNRERSAPSPRASLHNQGKNAKRSIDIAVIGVRSFDVMRQR